MEKSFFNKQDKLIWIFSLILIGLSLLSYFLYPMLIKLGTETNSNFIGYTYKSKGDIRERQGDSINWVNIGSKSRVYSNSYIFTGKKSNAKFIFLDESTLSLMKTLLLPKL